MDKLSPQKAFLCIILIFGLLLTVFTPPFKVPDEINHFYRAWQVSTGTFSSIKQNQRLGGYIPKSLENFSSEFRPFTLIQYNKMTSNYVWQKRLIALNQNDTIFKDYANTALYSAFIYLPQAFGIFIGAQFGASPFWLLYAGRLCNLIIYIILVYNAIKIVPFKKWLFVLLATLPMSLSINSSLSADMFLNAISFLLIAIVLNLSFNENIRQVSKKHILSIFILAVLIGLAKLVYIPILFLLVLIPGKKFAFPKLRIWILSTVICAGIGTAVIQKTVIDSKYIPFSEYNETFREHSMLKNGVDINKQMEYILENPKHTIHVFFNSFFKEFKYMSHGYIGVLGWSDIILPSWFIYIAYFVIFFLTAMDFKNSNMPNFTFLQRSYFGLIVFSLLILIMLSQYLSWDLVGEDKVYPLQGRYFIPVFPIFFIMLFNVIKNRPWFPDQQLIAKGVFVFCLFSGVLSIYLIITKSYTSHNYVYPKWEISYCADRNINDIARINNNVEFIVSKLDTIAALYNPSDNLISNKKVFLGNHSLQLTNNNPYGATLKIYRGLANDKIIVSCRSSNYGGCLVFQEYPEGLYYNSAKNYPKKDSLGWKYHESQFILPHDIPKNTELRVYFWYPGNDSVYIDNFNVLYFEKD